MRRGGEERAARVGRKERVMIQMRKEVHEMDRKGKGHSCGGGRRERKRGGEKVMIRTKSNKTRGGEGEERCGGGRTS